MNQTLKVVKIGGKLIENMELLSVFLDDFLELSRPKILVHGGGNKATELASKLGYQTKMVDGRRITDEHSLEVITMVYGGLLNKNIVAALQSRNINAIGLCGADGKSVVSVKRPVKEIDFGLVGDIEKINTEFIQSLLDQDICPVFSAISCTEEGQLLNTNGDSVASEIAIAMSQVYNTELYYCFEKKGVLKDPEDNSSVIEELNFSYYEHLISQNIITAGMLPKLHNCFQALERGVSQIYLGDAALLKEGSIHTKIVK